MDCCGSRPVNNNANVNLTGSNKNNFNPIEMERDFLQELDSARSGATQDA